MDRAERARLLLVVAVTWAAMAGLAFAKGALFTERHEGDTLHLVAIVSRMLSGDVPHLDFMTPIGGLAFWPIVWTSGLAGVGIGLAFIAAQALMAVPVLAAATYAAGSRMRFWPGIVLSIAVAVLMLALVPGGTGQEISASMHYNRWAWAISFIVLALAVLPGHRPVVDGILIGLGIAALAMIKVTYVLAFVPPVLLALALRGAGKVILVAIVSGLGVAAAASAAFGIAFWQAYFADLLFVAASDARPNPSDPIAEVIAAPAYILGGIISLAALLLLRREALNRWALLILALLPGAYFVTYQNFGNDPLWLLLLGVLLLCAADIAPPGGRGPITMVAVLAMALVVPSFINMAMSPLRNYAATPASYAPLVPGNSGLDDIWTTAERAGEPRASVTLEAFFDPSDNDGSAQTELKDLDLPDCQIISGLPTYFASLAEDLVSAGLEDRPVYVADLFNPLWLYGDLSPLRDGAPWYYGGLPGIESADYLLVPRCAILPRARREALDAIVETRPEGLSLIRDTSRYWLFSRHP